MARNVMTRADILALLASGQIVIYKGKVISSVDDPDLPADDAQIVLDYPMYAYNKVESNARAILGYEIVGVADTANDGDVIKWDATNKRWIIGAGGGGGSSSLTVGTTAISSGTAGRLLYETSGNVLGEIPGITWDATAQANLNIISQSTSFAPLAIKESSAATILPFSWPALLILQADSGTNFYALGYTNVTAPVTWANWLTDEGALQFQAGTTPGLLNSGGVGFATSTSRSKSGVMVFGSSSNYFGFYGDATAAHIGNMPSYDLDSAAQSITINTTATGGTVGINKPSSIGAQLHVVSALAARTGFRVDAAASSTTDTVAIYGDSVSGVPVSGLRLVSTTASTAGSGSQPAPTITFQGRGYGDATDRVGYLRLRQAPIANNGGSGSQLLIQTGNVSETYTTVLTLGQGPSLGSSSGYIAFGGSSPAIAFGNMGGGGNVDLSASSGKWRLAKYLGGSLELNLIGIAVNSTTSTAASLYTVAYDANTVGLRVDSAVTPTVDVLRVSADNGTTTHFKVDSTGAPSAPRGTNGQVFGDSNTVGSVTQAFAFGYGNNCSANYTIAIGANNATSGAGVGNNLYIGWENSNGNTGNTIAIGRRLGTSGNALPAGSIVLGMNGASGTGPGGSASASFVAGTGDYPMNTVYFGKGFRHSTPTAYVISGTTGLGTDIGGADVQFAGGRGTGIGTPGKVALRYSLLGTTGSTTQPLSSNSFPVPSTMFTATADAAVSNTVTETTILGTGVGTKTIEANMLRVGMTFRITVLGYVADTGTPTLRIRWKLGSTTIADTGAVALSANLSGNEMFTATFTFTCRTLGATGTVMGQGRFIYHTTTGSSTDVPINVVNTAATTIDTTAAQAVDVTAEWGTADAANTITATNAIIEIIN